MLLHAYLLQAMDWLVRFEMLHHLKLHSMQILFLVKMCTCGVVSDLQSLFLVKECPWILLHLAAALLAEQTAIAPAQLPFVVLPVYPMQVAVHSLQRSSPLECKLSSVHSGLPLPWPPSLTVHVPWPLPLLLLV